MRYCRDLEGYGATPPRAQWPEGARIAVQFVVNYEEGGENCVLHGDAASEAFLSEIVGAAQWPGQGCAPTISDRNASEAGSPCKMLLSPPSS